MLYLDASPQKSNKDKNLQKGPPKKFSLKDSSPKSNPVKKKQYSFLRSLSKNVPQDGCDATAIRYKANTLNQEINVCIYYCDSLTAVQSASFNFCDFSNFCRITLLKNI